MARQSRGGNGARSRSEGEEGQLPPRGSIREYSRQMNDARIDSRAARGCLAERSRCGVGVPMRYAIVLTAGMGDSMRHVPKSE